MAKDNIEVEIKVKLSKIKFENIEKILKKSAKFNKVTHHIDTYYNSKHLNFLKPKYPYIWLSVRERGEKILLNYKHWYPEGAKDTTHCDEYETKIEDKIELDKILKVLNITKLVTVDKTRKTYIYKNDIEIAMDKVKGLGYFIEAESLENSGGVEKTYAKLKEFLQSLGIKNFRMIPGGYAAEMLRRKGLMKPD